VRSLVAHIVIREGAVVLATAEPDIIRSSLTYCQEKRCAVLLGDGLVWLGRER
jgi:hypothetical protein